METTFRDLVLKEENNYIVIVERASDPNHESIQLFRIHSFSVKNTFNNIISLCPGLSCWRFDLHRLNLG